MGIYKKWRYFLGKKIWRAQIHQIGKIFALVFDSSFAYLSYIKMELKILYKFFWTKCLKLHQCKKSNAWIAIVKEEVWIVCMYVGFCSLINSVASLKENFVIHSAWK